MNKLKQLLGTEVPLIAVGFADKTESRVIGAAMQSGLDVAELRIDLFTSFESTYVVSEVKRFSPLPTVATIRVRDEGGKWPSSEKARLSLFRTIIKYVDGVDIELAADEILSDVIRLAKAEKKLTFVSYHNFESTPGLVELEAIARRAKQVGADYIKIATTANGPKDLRTLAAFTIANAELGLVTIAMGSKGLTSRLFFPALGSRLTYAYIGQQSAPGQLRFEDTFELMRKFYPEFNQRKIVDLELMEAI